MAEHAAELMLRLKGYRILERRYKTSYGEVDLIAKTGETLAFIEVKARKAEADALEAIGLKSQKRIMDAAMMFIAKNPAYQNYEMRFDVVTLNPGGLPRHYKNMWHN